jgi:integrase
MTNNRRSHGEGSVTARGPNRWRIRYDGPTAADGSRRQVSETISGTKSKALAVLRERIRTLETGQFVRPSQLTVGHYMNGWLRSHAEHVSPKTLENYASMVKNHIEPIVGQIKLQNLEPHHLSTMFDAMSEKQLSSATRAFCHKTMRKALGDAIRQNLITSNPVLSVIRPRQQRREPETWTTSQFNEFLKTAQNDEFRDFFELAALTGMRRSEIAGLKWDKVDLDRNELRVAETLQRIIGRGLVTGVPKTRGSRRVIALSLRSVVLLKDLRVGQLEQQLATGSVYEDTGYVFTDQLGKPYDGGRPSKHFRDISRSAKLPKQNLHSLRHFHASVLLAAGTHFKVVSERLGHSSVAFTMDVYQHLMPGMQEQAATTIDRALAAE